MSEIVTTTCTTSDGLTLEAELARAAGSPRAAAVLCHPHPQFGGTMRSIVIGALFDALPEAGVTCLRFNFRGVEGSEGFHDSGSGEQLDVLAAIATLDAQIDASLTMLLAGWSFGADLTLATASERVAGWFAIAPPLRSVPDFSAVARDPRPKLLALAEHDEIRDAEWVVDATRDWVATDIEIIGGASHYFVGRTNRIVESALRFVDRLTSPT